MNSCNKLLPRINGGENDCQSSDVLVPHRLTDDQKQACLEVSKDFVEIAEVIPNFLNCIFTALESWCLERNGKACNGVLLHDLFGKMSEQKNRASKRCSSPFLIVKALSTRNFYLRE
ncbi:hypothetical protein TNCV_1072671 [Trichonephila clavipes]|nr:hypothetical protein TNCV_1072671 [Trichonephila clavipes]